MQTKKRQKGKNWFVNEYNKIYVCGTIEGKFKRASTGLEASSNNIKFISYKQNALNKLIELTDTKSKIKTDFENFGIESLKAGAKKRLQDGSWSKKGRATEAQKNAETSFFKHLVPFFKNYTLEEINAFIVEEWQDKKAKEGYASDSISKWRNYLSQIMDRAVKYELVSTNKVELADPIEVIHEKRSGYTVEEARSMMNEATGMMKAWLYIAFNTGIRVGEEKGIQIPDIDFDHNCIYIQRSISGNTVTVSSKTKNHNRIVYFSNATAEILQAYITDNNLKNWLFETNQKSFYKSSKTINKYYLQPLLQKLKIEGTLGMTRKTFASVAKSYAMEEDARQVTMGHKIGSDVTDAHYTFSKMTNAQAQKGQEQLAPVNNVLFVEITKKA